MPKSDNNLKSVLQDTANAIRGKTGSSAPITPRDFADEIEGITAGGDQLNDLLNYRLSGVVNLDDGVKCIPSYMFQYQSQITKIVGNEVRVIDSSVFTHCSLLSELVFPKLYQASIFTHIGNGLENGFSVSFPLYGIRGASFYIQNCTKLKTIDLPFLYYNNAMGMFSSCDILESANIPFVTYFREYTFSNCFKLKHFYSPLVTMFGSSAFFQCKELPSICHYKYAGFQSGACYGCQKLSLVKVRTNIIASNAFMYCYSLSQLMLLNYGLSTLATLQNTNAFMGTPLSTSASLGYFGSIYVPASMIEDYKSATNWVAYSDRITALPSEIDNECAWPNEFESSTLTEIPSEKLNAEAVLEYAFKDCVNLSSVNLSNCKFVHYGAFLGCTNLSEISLPKCLEVSNSAFKDCASLNRISIPECGFIGNQAFEGCSNLENISIPKAIGSIGQSAFRYCSKLKKIRLSYVGDIGSYAFYGCSNLKKILLEHAYALYSGAFVSCTSLESVYFLRELFETPWSSNNTGVGYMVSYAIFMNTPMSNSSYLGHYGSIYVRASLVEKFKSAYNWSHYSSRIVGLTDEEIQDVIDHWDDD